MRNLLVFLSRYHHWFVFVLLEVVSVVLLFRYNSYQGSVWFSSANVVAGKVYEWDSAVESFFSLREVNERLTERNLYLERQLQLMGQRMEALGDTTKGKPVLPILVDSAHRAMIGDYHLIPAKVISNEIDKRDNFITIDKGRVDGVRKDMGVASGNGIVGIVYLVSDYYSVVMPVLNSRSHISCAIRGRGYFGYLQWQGGPSDVAYIDDIPRHARFKKGDDIVTSGYSSMFPPGIQVGKILVAFNSSNGLSYRLKVKLATDFGKLRDVCVIDDATMRQRMELLRAAEDSLRSVAER